MATVALLEKHPNPTPEQARRGARRQHLPLRHVRRASGSGDDGEGGGPWLTIKVPRRPAPARARRARQEVRVARAAARCIGTPRQARSTARTRSRAARSTPTTSTAPACSTADRPLAAPARAARLGRSLRGAEGARREGRARVAASRGSAGDVSRATSRRGRRRHRRARAATRRGSIKVEYEVLPHSRTSSRRWRPTRRLVFHRRQHQAGRGRGERRSRRRLQGSRARRRGRPTRRTSSRTSASRRTARVCEWDGDKLTAWVSTQAVHGTQDGFAQALNIPQANVRVITQYMGGGFGSKFGARRAGPHLREARARRRSAPVKLMLDRKEEHLATGNRPSAAAQDPGGRRGRRHAHRVRRAESWGTGGAGAASGFPLPYIYDFPNRRRAHKDVYINAGQQRAMRAPGHPQGCFLTEILMDELADRVKMDPVEFRIKNLPPAGAERDVGRVLPDRREGVRLGQAPPDRRPDARPDQDRHGLRGAPLGRRRPRDRRRTAKSPPTAASSMKCGTQDLGTGTRTIVAIVTAETLGLPVERGQGRDRRHATIRSAAARAAARRRRR